MIVTQPLLELAQLEGQKCVLLSRRGALAFPRNRVYCMGVTGSNRVRKPCRHFDQMLWSSSGRKWKLVRGLSIYSHTQAITGCHRKPHFAAGERLNRDGGKGIAKCRMDALKCSEGIVDRRLNCNFRWQSVAFGDTQ